MRVLCKVCLISFFLLLPAWAAVITISFDETNGNPTVPNGVTFTSGVLILCEVFDLGQS